MVRKSLEMELLEAKLRAARAWQKRKEDLEWKHDVFWPTVDAYKANELEVNRPELENPDAS